MSTVLTNDEAKENIAANLQRLMEDRSMSSREIAAETGDSHTIICDYAKGAKLANSAALARIAELFGVTSDELLSPPPQPPKRPRKKSA